MTECTLCDPFSRREATTTVESADGPMPACAECAAAEAERWPADDEPQWAVWYAAMGCLPDGDGPEYVGTYAECEAYIAEQVANGVPSVYEESDHPGNTYAFWVEAYTPDEDETDAEWEAWKARNPGAFREYPGR